MTKIVGILNVTPDSFSDGGQFNTNEKLKERVAIMFAEGADIIDVGAESTRPGAQPVSEEVEWERLCPAVEHIRNYYSPEQFSFDTRHGAIVKRIVELWSSDILINDVTSLNDPIMVESVALHGLRVIVSHLPRAAAGNISQAHQGPLMTSQECVLEELEIRCQELADSGVDTAKIILDPGIGFGKTPQLNEQLVEFAQLTDMPVMIGYSRKRFLGERRFDANSNAKLGERAVHSGAAYLRVHDVAQHRAMLNRLRD